MPYLPDMDCNKKKRTKLDAITKDEHDETSRWLRAEPKEKSILGHTLVLGEHLEQTMKRMRIRSNVTKKTEIRLEWSTMSRKQRSPERKDMK